VPQVAWTGEAEALVARAPFFVRPLIRRRVEAAARQAGRAIINAEFVTQLRDAQMAQSGPVRSAPGGAQGGPGTGEARLEEIRADLAFLAQLTALYCEARHGPAPRQPVEAHGRLGGLWPAEPPACCPGCAKLLLHAGAKRLVCPHDPKPSCRHCQTPCQREDYRAALAEVMRWGMGKGV
jgi:hypothetical protein